MIRNIIILSFIVIITDAIYLNTVASYFNTLITNIQGSPIKLRMQSAAACYILLVSTLYYAIDIKKLSMKETSALGFVIYGIYETTNHAILKNWTTKAIIMDTVWGAILFALTHYLYNRFK